MQLYYMMTMIFFFFKSHIVKVHSKLFVLKLNDFSKIQLNAGNVYGLEGTVWLESQCPDKKHQHQ